MREGIPTVYAPDVSGGKRPPPYADGMPTPIRFATPAGHALAGTLFAPAAPPRGAVLIAPATGIRRGFYAPFAEWLAAQGFGVLSFEFQGIGDSLDGALQDCPD